MHKSVAVECTNYVETHWFGLFQRSRTCWVQIALCELALMADHQKGRFLCPTVRCNFGLPDFRKKASRPNPASNNRFCLCDSIGQDLDPDRHMVSWQAQKLPLGTWGASVKTVEEVPRLLI